MTSHDSLESARYWDANREKSKDPTFWMAHPLCRQAINERVSGSPHEWPLDWFKRTRVPASFRLGLSIGCGLGAFERSAIKCGLVERIHALDISEKSLADARSQALREGFQSIDYLKGDFNNPVLPFQAYDAVFFHASLHHVAALELLFRRLSLALKPGAAVYVDEYVGPSRTEWKAEDLARAQAFLNSLPSSARAVDQIALPIQADDPSEAVRSSEIPLFLREFFSIIEWRPYGGQMVDLLFPCLQADWVNSPDASLHVRRMLEVEKEELQTHPSASHHVVAYGRLKPAVSLAAAVSRFAGRSLIRRFRI